MATQAQIEQQILQLSDAWDNNQLVGQYSDYKQVRAAMQALVLTLPSYSGCQFNTKQAIFKWFAGPKANWATDALSIYTLDEYITLANNFNNQSIAARTARYNAAVSYLKAVLTETDAKTLATTITPYNFPLTYVTDGLEDKATDGVDGLLFDFILSTSGTMFGTSGGLGSFAFTPVVSGVTMSSIVSKVQDLVINGNYISYA